LTLIHAGQPACEPTSRLRRIEIEVRARWQHDWADLYQKLAENSDAVSNFRRPHGWLGGD
jgi:hypothetical protein